jgi:transcriptional regulator with XRE-family HTH domain
MNQIREILQQKGVKQKWLAEQLQMTPVMVNQYVNNVRQPKEITLKRIAMILGVKTCRCLMKNIDYETAHIYPFCVVQGKLNSTHKLVMCNLTRHHTKTDRQEKI